MSSMSMPVVGLIPVQLVMSQPTWWYVTRDLHGDPRRQATSALAIRDGVITAIGDDHDVAHYVLMQTRWSSCVKGDWPDFGEMDDLPPNVVRFGPRVR